MPSADGGVIITKGLPMNWVRQAQIHNNHPGLDVQSSYRKSMQKRKVGVGKQNFFPQKFLLIKPWRKIKIVE